MVDLSVPRGTRSRTVFCRKFLPTNYACNSGVARILRHGSVWSGQMVHALTLGQDTEYTDLESTWLCP
ncbi:hypothetical protein J6590_063411 [Homalodisca vitripennis]|nr:hypothetical protein J6590_063411 [Homalodisca vitripennis]